ncbi:alpha/beta fold hydrolase [Chitinophaga solisilvae]|uniref:alpha/beta fold hydrolase n=1 Tax=Chitinophaga solisilvae TaxID=1233460 RepID=UPI001368826E|nr:alpha/beta hydrolase [Chitinophaga solisilvae]
MHTVTYHQATVDGLQLFYRQAGDATAPVILLLHGFPSSSHMFRDLIPLLAERYHVIAPDYPGFGHSSHPTPESFEYSFDHLSVVMEHFIDHLQLRRFHLYVQDYGGPIGFRIAVRRPELIASLLIQNANAYTEGLGPFVQRVGALQDAGDWAGMSALFDYMISEDGIKDDYMHGAKNPARISPDAWKTDASFMNTAIQRTLFANYKTNFPLYPVWQAYLRQYQPRTLITWGKHDRIFPGEGAVAYLKDLPEAELHLLDGGHFVLEEYHREVAALIRKFIG